MMERQPPARAIGPKRPRRPLHAVVQMAVEDDMPIVGGGHAVREEELPQRTAQRGLLLLVLGVGIVLLLAPLLMGVAFLARLLAAPVQPLGVLWIALLVVMLLLGGTTTYYIVRRNL